MIDIENLSTTNTCIAISSRIVQDYSYHCVNFSKSCLLPEATSGLALLESLMLTVIDSFRLKTDYVGCNPSREKRKVAVKELSTSLRLLTTDAETNNDTQTKQMMKWGSPWLFWSLKNVYFNWMNVSWWISRASQISISSKKSPIERCMLSLIRGPVRWSFSPHNGTIL